MRSREPARGALRMGRLGDRSRKTNRGQSPGSERRECLSVPSRKQPSADHRRSPPNRRKEGRRDDPRIALLPRQKADPRELSLDTRGVELLRRECRRRRRKHPGARVWIRRNASARKDALRMQKQKSGRASDALPTWLLLREGSSGVGGKALH